MNNDLISREALKKAIEDYQIQWNKNCDIDIAKWDCCENILAIIDNVPTVKSYTLEDLEKAKNNGYKWGRIEGKKERPQGEWIRKVDYSDDYETRIHYECDKCGYRPYYKAESDNDACTLNYCGNCGVKMKNGKLFHVEHTTIGGKNG